MSGMTLRLTLWAVAAGGLGAVVVWWVRHDFWVPRLPRWSQPFLVTIAGLCVTGFVGLMALMLMSLFGGLDYFGSVHLAYLGLVVAVPLVGSALAVRALGGRRGLPRWSAALALGLLLPVPVGVYATHVEPYRLGVDEVVLEVDPAHAGEDPVRIGVLADLQTDNPGSFEQRAVDLLLNAEPDMILIPGDLFQGSLEELTPHLQDMRALVRRLEAPAGVYFVSGDTDGWGQADRILAGSSIVTLTNEVVEVSVGDRRILLGGTPLNHWSEESLAVLDELQVTPGEDTMRMLMAHRPDIVLDLPSDSRVDLTVAGHTHGGQVVVPGLGPLVTASKVQRHVARGGLHEVSGNQIYVSTGVGLERGQAPQVRLFSRPSVGIIELE